MIETLTTRKSVQLSPVWAALHEESSLGCYFQELLNEKPKSDFDGKCLWYRGQAIRSFTKTDFATFPYKKPMGWKNLLDAEVTLWRSILNLARELKTWGFWKVSPELTLCEIVQESGLVLLPIVFSGENEGKQSVDDCITFYQQQNVALQDSNATSINPFDRAKTPVTKDFIESAMHIANQDNNFRARYYMPMVRARKAFTAVLKKEKMVSLTEQGQLKRGKKKAKNT